MGLLIAALQVRCQGSKELHKAIVDRGFDQVYRSACRQWGREEDSGLADLFALNLERPRRVNQPNPIHNEDSDEPGLEP
eukprot:7394722-Pyramimonas_sp.AAC.1